MYRSNNTKYIPAVKQIEGSRMAEHFLLMSLLVSSINAMS